MQSFDKTNVSTPAEPAASSSFDAHLYRAVEYAEDLGFSYETVEPIIRSYLRLGNNLLNNDPQQFDMTVEQILEAASYMSVSAATKFLKESVSEATFEFQRRYQELISPSSISFSGELAFHINRQSVLDSLTNNEMIPLAIRQPKFDYDEGVTDHNVCFATGGIDDLAVFLVGHAFLRGADGADFPGGSDPRSPYICVDLAEAWSINQSRQKFSAGFSCAYIGIKNRDFPQSMHDIESPVRPDQGTIEMILSPGRVTVDRLTFPHSVLTPDQVSFLKEEAQSFKKVRLRDNPLLKRKNFEDQYVLVKSAELAVKFALLSLFESHRAARIPIAT